MAKLAPVMKLAPELARYATPSATSSTSACVAAHVLPCLIGNAPGGFMCVSVGSGWTLLILMPRAPRSRAKAFVSPAAAVVVKT